VHNVLVTAAFAWMMYGMSAVTPAAGPAVGAPAPDFAVVAQDGRTVHLADFRGAPLVLVFYRGHW
jgi:cytochrome oxidase Cu insertion factor (SCO1/SenC/PrrC family)